MTEAYSDYAPSQPRISASYPTKVRSLLDARIRKGSDGIDLNEPYEGQKRMRHGQDIIYRQHHMSERVFDLGCKLVENKQISPQSWVNWMSDAEISVGQDVVSIYHRNAFFCEGAQKRFGAVLAEYFKLPVEFTPDFNIEQRVAI